MKTITGKWLRLQGACESQVRVVEATWPQGAELTEANLRIAAELSLDLDWLASHVLVAPALARFKAERASALWNALERQFGTSRNSR